MVEFEKKEDARDAYFSQMLALICGVLTCIPEWNGDRSIDPFPKNMTGIEKIGSFGRWHRNPNIFFKRNVIRHSIFSAIVSLRKPFGDIFWHHDLAEYIFFDYSFPFCGRSVDYLRIILRPAPDDFIANEAEFIHRRLHSARVASFFSEFCHAEEYPIALARSAGIMEEFRGCVDCLQ